MKKKKRKKRPAPKAPAVLSMAEVTDKIDAKRTKAMEDIAMSLMNPHMLKGLEQRARAMYELRTMPEIDHLGVQREPHGHLADAIILGHILDVPCILDSSTQADETAFLIQWAHFGYPVFRPSTDLMAGVLLSDPSHMQQGDLHVPFPAYVIEIPEEYREVLITSGPNNSRWETLLAGFGVMLSPTERIPLNQGEPAHVTEKRVLSASYKDATMTVTWARAGDQVTKEELLNLGPNKMQALINRGVYATLRKQRLDDPTADMSTLFDHTVRPDATYWSPEDNTTLDAIGRVGVGISLYIQTKREDLKPDVPKRTRARQKGLSTRYTVGRAVKLPGMTGAAKSYARGEGKARKTRWVRRGHWRNQAYGPRWSLHRPVWIEPKWMGRGEFAPRKYDVT